MIKTKSYKLCQAIILCIATIILMTSLNLEAMASDYSNETQVSVDDKVETLGGSFKPWMDYETITDKNSKQYELQQLAYTDENGLRKIDDYYIVAIGQYYATECGKKFKIILENEIEFCVIVGDIKQTRHTDSKNQYCVDSKGRKIDSLIEFIVDSDLISDESLLHGTIVEFPDKIISITEITED